MSARLDISLHRSIDVSCEVLHHISQTSVALAAGADCIIAFLDARRDEHRRSFIYEEDRRFVSIVEEDEDFGQRSCVPYYGCSSPDADEGRRRRICGAYEVARQEDADVD